MKFTTEIEITASAHRVQPHDTIVLMGSCFAQEIGEWFQSRRFSLCLNPNGIIFHPSVLARIIRRAMDNRPYESAEWVEGNGLFHSFNHHGSFSRMDSGELTESANQSQSDLCKALSNASTLIITWGSAWGYKWKESAQWVANCHKIPQVHFTKELMECHAIEEEWREVLQQLAQYNPRLNIIFSVSPVRYWRDGAHGNQLSKSHLLIAASRLAADFPNVHYFPAYEILLDELRDYRFYASDMLHPSSVAVEFIIQKFGTMFFSGETAKYLGALEPLLKFLAHRPLHVSAEEWNIRCAEKEQAINQLLYSMK